MKRQIVIAAVVAGIGLAGLSQAYADWGKRGGGGNYGNCPQYQGQAWQQNQIDPAAQEKMDTFFNDTQDLRKEMAMKQAEKQALMRGDNPDPAALSQITGELFDLRTTMRQKAEEAGVTQFIGPMGGRGGGPGMRGPGRDGQPRGNMMGKPGFRNGKSRGNMMGNPGFRGASF
jgi:zinc resistance-associated protein